MELKDPEWESLIQFEEEETQRQAPFSEACAYCTNPRSHYHDPCEFLG